MAIYFTINTSTFFTSANFKTLLPYVAPFAILGAGEVFVMILGEIDLSIGGTYLLAPFLFYKLATAGLPLVPSVILALLACMAGGLGERLLHGGRGHQLVRRDARDAVHARGSHADHLSSASPWRRRALR